jgi:hypothetical protein
MLGSGRSPPKNAEGASPRESRPRRRAVELRSTYQGPDRLNSPGWPGGLLWPVDMTHGSVIVGDPQLAFGWLLPPKWRAQVTSFEGAPPLPFSREFPPSTGVRECGRKTVRDRDGGRDGELENGGKPVSD